LIIQENFQYKKIVNYLRFQKFPKIKKHYRERIDLFKSLKMDYDNRTFLIGVNAERRPVGLYTDDQFNTRQYLKRLSYQVFNENYEGHA
jgi:hypothetical protein